jgi:TolB protein
MEERRQIAGQLSFIAERDGNREVYVIAPDGAGERRITSSPADDYNGPASPDGAALLLIRADGEHGPQQLFLQPLEGGTARPLSPLAGKIRHPSFSPDGKWVVYESGGASGGGKPDPADFSDIYRVGPDGKGALRLTKNPEGNYEPAFSPQGDAVVILSSRDRVAELYRIRPDGSEPVRLTETPRDEWGARFSPTGEELVFVSDRGGADRIHAMPAKGGAARRLTRRDTSVKIVEDNPTWAPVGRTIAYVVSAPSVPSAVILLDLDSGREIVVPSPEGGGDVTSPAWSPDGKHLAVTVTQGKDSQIYLVRADGTAMSRLTTAAGPNWNPRWVPPKRKQGG